MVEPTPLKNISKNGNLPQVGVKIKNVRNHHLVFFFFFGLGDFVWRVFGGLFSRSKIGDFNCNRFLKYRGWANFAQEPTKQNAFQRFPKTKLLPKVLKKK